MEKSFNHGIIIPTKMRRCNKRKGEIFCDRGDNQINENKDFEANIK